MKLGCNNFYATSGCNAFLTLIDEVSLLIILCTSQYLTCVKNLPLRSAYLMNTLMISITIYCHDFATCIYMMSRRKLPKSGLYQIKQ